MPRDDYCVISMHAYAQVNLRENWSANGGNLRMGSRCKGGDGRKIISKVARRKAFMMLETALVYQAELMATFRAARNCPVNFEKEAIILSFSLAHPEDGSAVAKNIGFLLVALPTWVGQLKEANEWLESCMNGIDREAVYAKGMHRSIDWRFKLYMKLYLTGMEILRHEFRTEGARGTRQVRKTSLRLID